MLNDIWWKIKWIIFWVLVLYLIVVSCSDDYKENAKTSPASGGQIEYFYRVGTGSSDQYKAYKEQGSFLLNIPVAGHYRMLYTTNPGNFELIFRISERSLIRAELQSGDSIHEVSLQKGTIIDAPSSFSEVLEIFEDHTFEPDSTFGTLMLIEDGEELIPTSTSAPTPTPASSATPTPLPASQDDTTVIAAIGDSITYGQDSLVGGYPLMLESKLQSEGYNVRVNNEGIPGACAQETDASFELLANGADIVLIMIGTNDVIDAYNCPAPQYCYVSAHIQSMVNKAKQLGITPLVSTIPPTNSTGSYSWANLHIRQANTQIQSEVGAVIVNNHKAILSQGGDALFSDALHFNDHGYEVIAEEWYNALVSGGFLK